MKLKQDLYTNTKVSQWIFSDKSPAHARVMENGVDCERCSVNAILITMRTKYLAQYLTSHMGASLKQIHCKI